MAKQKPKPTPWRLQYRWKSSEDFNKYSIRANRDAYTSRWFNGYGRYSDPEHVKKSLYRTLIDPFFDTVRGGREWRIINKETKKVFMVHIENKEIILI